MKTALLRLRCRAACLVLAGGLLLVMYFHIMKRYTEDLSGQK